MRLWKFLYCDPFTVTWMRWMCRTCVSDLICTAHNWLNYQRQTVCRLRLNHDWIWWVTMRLQQRIHDILNCFFNYSNCFYLICGTQLKKTFFVARVIQSDLLFQNSNKFNEFESFSLSHLKRYSIQLIDDWCPETSGTYWSMSVYYSITISLPKSEN